MVQFSWVARGCRFAGYEGLGFLDARTGAGSPKIDRKFIGVQAESDSVVRASS
jgi:hypothetical protein